MSRVEQWTSQAGLSLRTICFGIFKDNLYKNTQLNLKDTLPIDKPWKKKDQVNMSNLSLYLLFKDGHGLPLRY